MSKITTIKRKYPLVISVLLVLLGIYLFLNVYFAQNAVFALVLFVSATGSMIIIIRIWRNFTPKYAPKIIYWTTSHKWARKIIAGGSFTYYEYKDDYEKIGRFEPVSRFLNLMIAFLGLSTSISKMIGFTPTSPVETVESMLLWSVFLIIIPIILTPIIPIIWTMEDLKLKAWNAKTFENWRVSVRYKKRFNSFIAVGTISVGLGLTSSESLSFVDNALIFVNILLSGIILLIYPVAVLTLFYYLLFRGTINREVRAMMDIVTAKTVLDLVDPKTGETLAEERDGKMVAGTTELRKSERDVLDIIEEQQKPKETRIDDESEDENLLQRIGSGSQSMMRGIKRNTFGRIKRKKKSKTITGVKKEVKRKYASGSATRGLWDKEEEED